MLMVVSHPPEASGIIWSMAHPRQLGTGSKVEGQGNTLAKARSSALLRLMRPVGVLAGSPQ